MRERGDQGGGHQTGPVRAAGRSLGSEHAEGHGEHRALSSVLPTSSGQK